MKINCKNFEKVGSFGVDAGLCWIGDPCYCVTPDASSHPAKTWPEFCDMLEKKEKNGIAQWESGISASTGYGDGEYNVYAHFLDGRVSALFIDFMGIFEKDYYD
jgi:hypothetical protein